MSAPFPLEALSDGHGLDSFTSGQEALDRYIRTQATQDIRRRIATCFVAVESATGQLAAYYTIAGGEHSDAAASGPILRSACPATRHCPLCASAVWRWT